MLKKHGCPGKLVTFCGLDGSGKTTAIKLLERYLSELGYPVVLTKQPTSFMRQTEIFRNFMDCADHEGFDYRALSLMAAADRIQHCHQVILPALQSGAIVISDRYFYSCLANLRARGYVNDQWIYDIARFLPEPDLAIFLDTEVETAVKRVRSRTEEKDRYIDMELQFRLREEFLHIANLVPSLVANSEYAVKDTFDVIRQAADRMLHRPSEILELLHA